MKYIQACEHDAWIIERWKRDDPTQSIVVPFRCNSWRHKGQCRECKGRRDYERIRRGLKKFPEWCYCIFTYYQGTETDAFDCYRNGWQIWSRLRKQIIRDFGKFQYVMTWEKHRTGIPHANVVIHNEAMNANLRENDYKEFHRYLVTHAIRAGFGEVVHVRHVYDKKGMVKYLVKLANEMVRADKKDQTPDNAPPHFRRLRSSRGLLPPAFKDTSVTGSLFKVDDDGSIHPVRRNDWRATERLEENQSVTNGACP